MSKNERSIHILAAMAAKLGCDISGSTDDVDLCMVTHCRNPIGYAVLCGNQWSRISEQEFNKFSKPSKHVYIESIDVSLDPDTARLPGYRNASGSDAFQALFQLPELCQKNATLLMLFVLCITAPLLSILYPLFGGSIAVVLPGFRPSPSLRFCRNSCVPAAVRRNGKASTGRLLYLTAGSRTVSFVQLGRVMTLQIMQS